MLNGTRQRLSRNATTITVAAMTAILTVGGPPVLAATAAAVNAATVDGFSARSFTGNAANRHTILVATNAQGFLPNNIIVKAQDANKLDGLDSTAFVKKTEKAPDADKLDGKDSTDFLLDTEKAADADKLDGIDSTGFLPAAIDINITAGQALGANADGTDSALCTPGYHVTGGGVSLADPPGAIVRTSAPRDQAFGDTVSGWTATVNAGPGGDTFYVWVICVKGTSF